LLVVLATLFLVASFLLGGPRGLVAWDQVRAVAIESDDWGLAGFVPDADAWTGLDRSALDTGRFPAVYWLSTLEDQSMVRDLNGVLARHRGRDGHPAVLQPNYVLSSLEHVGERWVTHDLPDLPAAYARPGLWAAVREGIHGGTWYPELHAAWHYDPDLRKKNALEGDLAREVTARGIMLFPGSERARELGAWRPLTDLEGELDHNLAVFKNLFGRPVGSVIAPDYTWSDRVERLWASRNIRVIQGKREQINPAWGSGKPARLRKFLQRRWDQWRHPGTSYLERNCRLEPVQAEDPQQVVIDCAAATRQAWAGGQPAIVESHRVNFAHLDPGVVATGLESLDAYLVSITSGEELLPVFVTGREIAQLSARGTSWCVRGRKIVVRNATKSRRVVAVPAWAVALAGSAGAGPDEDFQSILVAVPSSSTIDLVP
jgi:hypothetical protein